MDESIRHGKVEERIGSTKAITLVVIGVVVAVTAQFYVPAQDGVRWWLNSQRGVYILLRALLLTGVIVGTTVSWPPRHGLHWLAAIFVWLGANAGLATVLFLIGPGNIFPIVLGAGAALTLIAVAAGILVGFGIRGLGQAAFRLIAK